MEKRNFLFAPDPKRPTDWAAIGDAFLEKGRDCEALDFYDRIPDDGTRRERVSRVKKLALERGDAFLLQRLAGKGLVEKTEWVEAGRAAKSAGRLRYALKCAIAAGDEAQVTELKAQLGIVDRVIDAARPEDAKVGVKTASGVAAAVGGEHSASGEGPIPTDKPPPSTGPTLV
jgi:hypothetical protein